MSLLKAMQIVKKECEREEERLYRRIDYYTEKYGDYETAPEKYQARTSELGRCAVRIHLLHRRILNLAARECLPNAPDYSRHLEDEEILELFEHEEIDWSKAERVKPPNLEPTDRCQVCELPVREGDPNACSCP